MNLAAVILNWRNAEATIRCATALQINFEERITIYIVDNNSGDESVNVFRERLPGCIILENAENTGYTGGNNFGLRRAFLDRHDAVLILNNDVEPRLSEIFHSSVANIFAVEPNSLIGLHVRNSRGKLAYPHQSGTFIKAMFNACSVDGMTPLICGCAMVVSRETFESIGGLNEEYFMYCEELEYSVRVSKGGGRVISPVELGYVVRDDEEKRRSYVYYYQARNLISLIRLHVSNRKLILTISSVLVSIRQSILTGKVINVLFSFLGICSALRRRTGRNPAVHR